VTYTIEFVTVPDPEIHQVILDGLRDFNKTVLAPGLPTEDLAIVIREPDSPQVIGGLWARTGRGWLSIELIFVPDKLRGHGIGRELIALAEAEGLRRGCHSAWLDTLNPRAAALYEALGYHCFGELKDFPVGNSRYFFQKKLKDQA
jgi:GNAT superfamily N-acetyltransferase